MSKSFSNSCTLTWVTKDEGLYDIENPSTEVQELACQYRFDHTEHPEEDAGWMSKEIRVGMNSLIIEPISNFQSGLVQQTEC